MTKTDKQHGSRRRREQAAAEGRPQRANSIVDAAYSAAMFSERGDKRAGEEKPAEEACAAG